MGNLSATSSDIFPLDRTSLSVHPSSVSPLPRFYLDHAATSWPKPPGSLEACIDFQTHNGASSGRGLYRSAECSTRLVGATRQSVARLIHAPSPKDVALCNNGTQALNAAILGLLSSPSLRGCNVVTTSTEHNSVLRPLELASKFYGIRYTAVPCDVNGWVDPNRISEAMNKETRLVIVNHASNVTGMIQDIPSISNIAKQSNSILMIDAAQTLGYVPIDVVKDGIHILAAPGHKGAGGMLGSGLLYVHQDIQHCLEPVWIGGTGTQSESISGPFDWLSAIESGNCNLPAIASLNAGIEWVEKNAKPSPLLAWTLAIIDAISKESNLRLIGTSNCSCDTRLPVISVTCASASCHELAILLDAACQVEARSGLHCAGLIHRDLGTQAAGGTLRISLGHTSNHSDVAAAIAGIALLGSSF